MKKGSSLIEVLVAMLMMGVIVLCLFDLINMVSRLSKH